MHSFAFSVCHVWWYHLHLVTGLACLFAGGHVLLEVRLFARGVDLIQPDLQENDPILPDPQYENPILPDPQYENPIQSDPQYENPIQSDPQYENPIQSDPQYENPVQSDPQGTWQDPSGGITIFSSDETVWPSGTQEFAVG